MQFNEHQARMLAEQRQREAEMKQQAYDLEMKQGKYAQSSEEQGPLEHESDVQQVRYYKRPESQEQKQVPKKKRRRWWKFFIGE